MLKKLINKIIMGTKCYLSLRERYDNMETSIKRITKNRNKYKEKIKNIKSILKGYSNKSKKELLDDIAQIKELCKGE